MKKNFQIILWSSLSLMICLSARASVTDHATRYLGQFHFSAYAFGKAVKSVTVHTGIETVRFPGSTMEQMYWKSVSDLPLVKNESTGDFTGKLLLRGAVSRGSMNTYETGVMVQYFVSFYDGTNLITEPTRYFDSAPVHIHESPYWGTPTIEIYRSAMQAWKHTSSPDATSVRAFTCADGYGIPVDYACTNVEREFNE